MNDFFGKTLQIGTSVSDVAHGPLVCLRCFKNWNNGCPGNGIIPINLQIRTTFNAA